MKIKKYPIIFWVTICVVLIIVSFGATSTLRSSPEKVAANSNSLSSRPMTASLMRFSLSDMAERADKVFRGTVINFTPSTVAVGGGELPMVIYLLQVDQAFKGNFEFKGDVQFVELRIVGNIKDGNAGGNITRFNVLPAPPELLVGHDYLLFTTSPSVTDRSPCPGEAPDRPAGASLLAV